MKTINLHNIIISRIDLGRVPGSWGNNISFGSSKETVNDFELPSDEFQTIRSRKQKKLIKKLTGLLANPDFRDQQKIKQAIEQVAGKNFVPVLNSRQIIERLLEEDFVDKNTSIDTEIKSILNKTLGNTVSLTHDKSQSWFNKKVNDMRNAYEKIFHTREVGSYISKIGNIYEDIAAKEVDRIIIPKIARKVAAQENISYEKALSQLIQLRNIRLSRNVEFDHVIVRAKNKSISIFNGDINVYENFDVLGIVETKYDPSLISYGYQRRKEDLCWLTNKTEGFDWDKYYSNFCKCQIYDEKTKRYFSFTPSSFKNFNFDKDSPESYENIYFITTNMPLVGLNEEILKQISDSNSVDSVRSKIFPNNFDEEAKSVLRKYRDYDLSDNIVFTNDDYCGYSLLSLIFYLKYYAAFMKMGTNFAHHQKLSQDLIEHLENQVETPAKDTGAVSSFSESESDKSSKIDLTF